MPAEVYARSVKTLRSRGRQDWARAARARLEIVAGGGGMRRPSGQELSPASRRRAGVLIAAPCTPG